MTSIDDLLAKPKTFESETVDVELAGELVTLKFTEMSGGAWAEVTSRCPQRPTVPVDMAYGYNVNQAVSLAAPDCGVQVVDGADVELTREQWAAVIDRLSGADFAKVSSVLFGLNMWAPEQRVAALKKGLAVTPASTKKSPSRSTSASPRRGSGPSSAPRTSAG